MKLLCVKQPNIATWDGTNNPAPLGPKLFVGNEYKAIGSIEFDDGISYFLKGKPRDCAYHHSLFATLPDQPAEITEEESVNLQPA
jgi:hypothetical protein